MDSEDKDSLRTQYQDDREAVARRIAGQFTRRLIALARPRLTSLDDPADVVQSVFRTFFRRFDDGQFDLESEDNLWHLLSAMTVRKCIRQHRYWSTDSRRQQGAIDAATRSVISQVPQPEHVAVLRETVAQVLQDLDDLGREVFILLLRGLNSHEISQELDIGLRTTQRHLKTIREAIGDADL